MYRLTKSRSVRQLVTQQLPTLAGALVVSELFYKFHSFTFECLAFLATWFVLDGLLALVGARSAPELPESTPTHD